MILIPAILLSLLPLIMLWRFKDVELDRDFAPYCYPAIFKTGYLEDGHYDIKPPLIHWSYKLWLKIIAPLKLTLPLQLRSSMALSLTCAIFITATCRGLLPALVLAILSLSLFAWPIMANTEWLTVSILSLLILPRLSIIFLAALLLLLILTNQKNIILTIMLPLSRVVPMLDSWLILETGILIGLLLLSYLIFTSRLNNFFTACVATPLQIGKRRTLKTNTMQSIYLLRPWIYLAAPFIACMDVHSPWFLIFLAVAATMLLSKQIVPHHYILLAFPIALSCHPTPLAFAIAGLIWFWQEYKVWEFPKYTYWIIFNSGVKGPIVSYQTILDTSKPVIKWILEHTKPADRIWVNGWENHIYLATLRKAWGITVPELTTLPKLEEMPKIIVHCANGSMEFDYKKNGYDYIMTTVEGNYTIMGRK